MPITNTVKDGRWRIARARAHLLTDHPWFGGLALRLKLEAGGTKTMSTNGTILRYNEEYVQERSDAELKALVAHEVAHCALGHPWRGGSRRWDEWNQATDIVINSILREEGFELPFHPLAHEEPRFKGMAAEQVYAIREREKQNGGGGQGQGQGKGQSGASSKKGQGDKNNKNDDDGQGQGQGQQPDDGQGGGQGQDNGIGDWPDIEPAPSESEASESDMTETDWQIAAQEMANALRAAGKMGANLDRALAADKDSNTDWRTHLRRFVEQSLPSDYSWTHPNRRFVAQGVYLPGVVRENTPRIGLAVDTSGSIDQRMLALFAAELTAILHEVRPERVDVIYCDTSVKSQESFDPDDAEIILHAKGGGGTCFQPALDHFTNDEEGPPVCVIYLTDLMNSDQLTEPDYPVLWAVPEAYRNMTEPFGERVILSPYE